MTEREPTSEITPDEEETLEPEDVGTDSSLSLVDLEMIEESEVVVPKPAAAPPPPPPGAGASPPPGAGASPPPGAGASPPPGAGAPPTPSAAAPPPPPSTPRAPTRPPPAPTPSASAPSSPPSRPSAPPAARRPSPASASAEAQPSPARPKGTSPGLAPSAPLPLQSRNATRRGVPAAIAAPPLTPGKTTHAPSADPTLPPLLPEAHGSALLASYERELTLDLDKSARTRLEHALAFALEAARGDGEGALTHLRAALALDAAHLPSLHDGRRIALALGEKSEARAFLAAEADTARLPEARVAALILLARTHEALGELDAARERYHAVLALAPQNLLALSALCRIESQAERWKELVALREKLSAALENPAHRAIIMVERGALLEMRLQNPALAAEAYRAALALHPGVLGAREGLERLHHFSGRHADRLAMVELRAERSDDFETKALALAEASRIHSERLGQLPEALAALERAAAARPGDPLLLEELAELHERSANPEGLFPVLSALSELATDPDAKVAILHRCGEIAAEAGRHSESIAALREALSIAPAHQPSVEAIETLLRAKGEFAALVEVRRAEARATARVERKVAAFCCIAELCESSLGDEAAAIHAWEEVLALQPAHARAFKSLARMYAGAGRHRDLIELHERAADGASEAAHKISHLFRAGSLWEYELGDPAAATQLYRRILALDAKNLGAIHALARAAQSAERYQDVVEAIDLEIKLTTHVEHRLSLQNAAAAILDEHLGNAYGASARYKKVLEEAPRDATALAALARIHREGGRWDELIALYEAQLDATSGRPAAELLCAMAEIALTKRGREDAAIAYYERARQAAPGFEPALRALSRLHRQRSSWSALAEVREAHARATTEPKARARLFHRAAQIVEERDNTPDRALGLYREALAADPSHRPSVEAVSRVLEREKRYEALVEQLDKDAQSAPEDAHALALRLRRAEVLRHALGMRDEAKRAYEVLTALEEDTQGSARLSALIALAHLAPSAADPADEEEDAMHDAVLQALAATPLDDAARAAAAIELAERQLARGDFGPARETLEHALRLASADRVALARLEEVALRTRDEELLVALSLRLADVAPDPITAAEHCVRHGWLVMGRDPAAAQTSFLDALKRDPASLAALRGLRELARAAGDTDALAKSFGREAAWTRARPLAADLFFEEARLESADPQRVDAAIASLECALDQNPEHEPAARELERLLAARGDLQRAVDVLGKAATAARDPARVVSLWCAVGELHVEREDLPAATGAFKRAQSVDGTHHETLQRLAEISAAAGRWPLAIPYLEKLLTLEPDAARATRARLLLAQALLRQPEGSARASALLDEVLEAEPTQRDALALVVELRRAQKDLPGAREVAARLVAITQERDAEALRALAQIDLALGDGGAHLDLLARAVAVGGPASSAASDLRALAERPTLSKAYVDALGRYVELPSIAAPERVAGYLEIARVYAESLSMGARAVEALEQGVHRTGGDPVIARELARHLTLSRKVDEGAALLLRLASQHPASGGLWRGLATLLSGAGRDASAALCRAPLVALGEATPEERRALEGVSRGGLDLPPGAMGPQHLAELAHSPEEFARATALLGALQPLLSKLYPGALQKLIGGRSYGRGSERSRQLAAQLGAAFGTRDFELFVVDEAAPLATVVVADPPAIVLTNALERGPAPQHAFHLARAIGSIACRTYVAEAMGLEEIALLMAAAGHTAVPEHGIDLFEPALLEEEARRVRKALPWLGSKPISDAAAAYVEGAALDSERWVAHLRATHTRIGWIAAGHLAECIEGLRALFPVPPEAGHPLSPQALALVGYAVSAPAATLRAKMGL